MPDPASLSDRLARQITASGPISISEYMRVSNAEYYARADPLGVDGDFITAPEISQMFGELVGLWFADLWLRQNRPENIQYAELGPGRGTLAADALRAMAKLRLQPPVHFVETSPALREKQNLAVPAATFSDGIDQLPSDSPLFIVANEFFDALPYRQFVATENGWREQMLSHDGQSFNVIAGQQSCDHMVPEDFRSAETGSIFETSPASVEVIYELSARLKKQGGAMLIIDYGYAQPGFGSSLQALKKHEYVDPFISPGEVDLTAHVNFMEIANLATQQGLLVSGPVHQGAWLSALGINQRADMLAVAAPDRVEDIMAARNRLVDTAQMGHLFKVLAISTPDWPTPEGFVQAID